MNWISHLSLARTLALSALWPLAWLGYVTARLGGFLLRQHWRRRVDHTVAFGWTVGAHWSLLIALLFGPSVLFLSAWVLLHV